MITRITIALCLLASGFVMAQKKLNLNNAYRIEDENIVLYLDKAWPRASQEELLLKSGMRGLSLDTLWRFGHLGRFGRDGWKLTTSGNNRYKIYKAVSDLSGNLKWDNEVVVFSPLWERMVNQTRAGYGFNSFWKKPNIVRVNKDAVQFFLPGNTSARSVYLSGTFNNWSTLKTPMIKRDSGWVVTVPMAAGKHCYKYVVDGRWRSDPQNVLNEDDFFGGSNSVYFKTNHLFTLEGYPDAQQVVVSGSFNKWNEREIQMTKTAKGWSAPVYLSDGTHAYKFLVDKKWITDPRNPEVRSDGKGNRNSYLRVGEPVTFELKGHLNAKQVIVAGNFNGWNERELSMKRTETGWELQYVLAAGNYQYKFIVDGEWMTDPKNPHYGLEAGQQNSLIAAKPNHTFLLKGYANAGRVAVAGNFSQWRGYIMKKTDEGWAIDIYLPPGKCLYKFIIDDRWIIDPGNELHEQNEHGTGNSVLWLTP